MSITVVQRHTLIAPGRRSYTFDPLPGGSEVRVRFCGPKYETEATVTTEEARALWQRLLRCGYERW